eukprot:UN00755
MDVVIYYNNIMQNIKLIVNNNTILKVLPLQKYIMIAQLDDMDGIELIKNIDKV